MLLGAVLLIASLGYIQIRGTRTFDAPYPEIAASTDSAVIARGEHLVFATAHCASCHAPQDKLDAMYQGGPKPALTGGWELSIPPVHLYASNITPDEETGIGKLTDAEIGRTLRHGVGHDGRYLLPLMPYSQMSDDDLQAIISYLRAQPAVRHAVPKTAYTFLGKTLIALGVLKPQPPAGPAPKIHPVDDPIAYGEYLAKGVANCAGCHTQTDLTTGQPTAPALSGGFYFEPSPHSDGYSFVSPNLTPDKATGVMYHWDEAAFIQRFKMGRAHQGSPMPWEAAAMMDTTELVALYRYFKSLAPVANEVARTVYLPGEAYE
jgi:mono/diheme cytochrome c family protein